MSGFHSLAQRLGAAAIALTAIVGPVAIAAQELPSYAQPAYVSTDETIHGRVRSVDGAFDISVDDDRGFVDRVQLHQGTIINPTGLTLSPGMSVTILGVNAGSAFNANEIDTPYTYGGPLPTPVYYGPGYWCPGFDYGYGPSFSLAIVIGGGYRPWSFEHRPFYGRPWDGHGYFGGYIGRGPESRGRVEIRRSFSNPSVRAVTSVRTDVRTPVVHVPPAFAGRSFAGGSRFDGERRSIEANGRAPAAARALPSSPAGGNFGRGPARTGVYATPGSGGGGTPHAGAPAPAGGGGHAHR